MTATSFVTILKLISGIKLIFGVIIINFATSLNLKLILRIFLLSLLSCLCMTMFDVCDRAIEK